MSTGVQSIKAGRLVEVFLLAGRAPLRFGSLAPNEAGQGRLGA